ncbi:putative homoserine dehydrogenase-like protein [Constrictibacter sp. MBR-5]|jgi:predicted homoserine dehydrogenase-like protein|uniref:NAD(P)H-dependent oxidoreductase n=1 Tax=Constrictibacter sp. MBR-5 TaxID=3156467 RepID=UPI003391C12F
MNLHKLLAAREAEKKPVRIGVIGAGKFGSMYLAQAIRTPGIHVLGIADLDLDKARAALARVGWPEDQYSAHSFAAARKHGGTFLTDDAAALIAADGLDVVIDATGNPGAGIRHALLAFDHGRHVVMVNVEADALAGPLLARRAAEAGVVYSLAYGDQPALICELVDWARTCGFEVIAAGKGTRYRPMFHQSTPETVWDYYGLSAEHARANSLNPQMFNSFIDGTKSGIEMAAVANATGLSAPSRGLSFPAISIPDLARFLKPEADDGLLERRGMVEVVSSEKHEGGPVPDNLRWGVYVVFAGDTEYVRRCFREYGLARDEEGNYAALWRPFHLIGLELGISVASAALRREATGSAQSWRADVVATAKFDLPEGDMLDGEGGYKVWGKIMPAERSLALGGLPIGLAHGVRLNRAVKAGETLRWSDVSFDAADPAIAFRRQMEAAFAPAPR